MFVSKYDFGKLLPASSALGNYRFNGELDGVFFFKVHIAKMFQYLGSILQFSRKMSQKIKSGLYASRSEFFNVYVRSVEKLPGELHDFIV